MSDKYSNKADLSSNIEKNLQYLSGFVDKSKLNSISSSSEYINWVASSKSEHLDYSLFNGQYKILNSLNQVSDFVETEFKASPKLSHVRLQFNTLQDSSDIASKIIDSDDFILSRSLIVNQADETSTSQCREFIFIGLLSLSLCIKKLSRDDLISLFQGSTFVYLVETNEDLFYASLALFDFQELVSIFKSLEISFKLIIADSVFDAQEKIFDSITKSSMTCIYGSRVFTYTEPDSDYMEIREWLLSQKGFGFRISGTLGFSADEYNQLLQATSNLLNNRNKKFIQYNKDAPSCHKGTSAIVTASGPSIDDHIDELKTISSNHYIIAAGSSLGTLIRNNVSVNATVILERSAATYFDLVVLLDEGFDLSYITLYCSTTVDPRISTVFGNVVFFDRPLSASFSLFSPNSTTALPHAGPESVNAALDVALTLGFESILLIGADLASPNRIDVRSKNALGHMNRVFDIPVMGNKGKTVFSQNELLLVRATIERSILFFPSSTVSRSGPGAKLQYVQETSLSEWLENLANISLTNIDVSNIESVLNTQYLNLSYASIADLLKRLIEANSCYFDNLISSIEKASFCDKELHFCVNQYVANTDDLVVSALSDEQRLYYCLQRLYKHVIFISMMQLYDSTSSIRWNQKKEEALASLETLTRIGDQLFKQLYELINS